MKKVWVVIDSFNGTDNDASDNVASVWEDEDMARAVANACYAHHVQEWEINTELPTYAEEEYKKIKRRKK